MSLASELQLPQAMKNLRSNSRRLILALAGCMIGAGASTGHAEAPPPTSIPAAPAPARRPYRIDAARSRFIVETETGGLSSLFGHDHKIAIRDFAGTATFDRDSAKAASLEMKIRANSLQLINENDIGARQAVESALREDVLETATYPEIVFKSRSVSLSRRGDGTYDVRVLGDLRLHGVRRPVTVPVRVSLEAGVLHAIGIFEIRQTDFNITPFSFVNGTVTIKDQVTLSFDIIASAS